METFCMNHNGRCYLWSIEIRQNKVTMNALYVLTMSIITITIIDHIQFDLFPFILQSIWLNILTVTFNIIIRPQTILPIYISHRNACSWVYLGSRIPRAARAAAIHFISISRAHEHVQPLSIRSIWKMLPTRVQSAKRKSNESEQWQCRANTSQRS